MLSFVSGRYATGLVSEIKSDPARIGPRKRVVLVCRDQDEIRLDLTEEHVEQLRKILGE